MHDERGHGGFFVPHDLAAPLSGSGTGPLAGLTAAVKDMYDIAGSRTGAGNPAWLATHAPAQTTRPRSRRFSPPARPSSARPSATNCSSASPASMPITGRRPICARRAAFPAARRAARRRRRRRAPATSRSAATPAARSASPPPSAASTACGRPMAASTSRARWRWRLPSTPADGLPPRPACSGASAKCCWAAGASKAPCARWSSPPTPLPRPIPMSSRRPRAFSPAPAACCRHRRSRRSRRTGSIPGARRSASSRAARPGRAMAISSAPPSRTSARASKSASPTPPP